MKIEHIAIWTNNLEPLKEFYCTYFGGIANTKYVNEKKKFQSYFISFEAGARLEIMSKEGVTDREVTDTKPEFIGYAHFAFGVNTMQEVDEKAVELRNNGFEIISGPRVTGDGYYEFETKDTDGNRIEVATKYNK
ncbi:VOC family protein [Flavihumibacter sp. UBA7668]|uniref:VOC family protein n=1 Tax=Flavihumibacter sp. UBA7668 TaxID=1946542 RepID=UPI0025BB0970|nr:VOC family protein [Flavihumibacter sp. UBA7668]